MIDAITQAIATHAAKIGCFIQTQEGSPIIVNGTECFPMASIIKLFVMVSAFRSVENSKLSLDEEINYDWHLPKIPGSIICHLRDGYKPTVFELISFMIAGCDSFAADILIKRIGMESIKHDVESIGLKDTSVDLSILELNMGFSGLLHRRNEIGSWPEYFKALQTLQNESKNLDEFDYTKFNYTTPLDVGRLLKLLISGELFSKEHTMLALNLLACHYNRHRLPAKLLPAVQVRNLIGTIIDEDGYGNINDCGIISYKNEDVIISLFAKDIEEDFYKIDGLFADIALVASKSLWKL